MVAREIGGEEREEERGGRKGWSSGKVLGRDRTREMSDRADGQNE